MNPSIQNIINEWLNSRGEYSFEKRQALPFRPLSNYRSVEFVIDVEGFFEDKDHKHPIRLHHKRQILIDTTNNTQQYADDLAKDLKFFTEAAYAEFQSILNSQPQPTYTSDPLYMKP